MHTSRIKKPLFLATAGILASLMMGSAVAPASALQTAPVSAGHSAYTAENITEQQLAHDLEVLFTRYVPQHNGHYFVNYENLKADGLILQAPNFERLALAFNGAAGSTNEDYESFDDESTQDADSFARCMIENVLGFSIPGLVQATKVAISAWNWGLAARTIIRIAGPVALRSFGGPATIALSLSWGVWQCRGSW